MKFSTQGISQSSSRHPWRVLVAWGVILVAAGMVTSKLLPSALSNDFDFTNQPESKRADTLIKDKITGPQPDTEFFIISSATHTSADPEFADFTSHLADDIRALGPKTVAQVTDPLAPQPGAETQQPGLIPPADATSQTESGGVTFISEDGHHVLMPVVMAGDALDAVDKADTLQAVIHEGDRDPAFETLVFGQGTAFADNKKLSEEDLRKGEAFGLLVAFVVLVVVFAALIAAFVPIIMGIFAIVVAIGLMSFMGIWFDFSFFVPNMITMMGLAVGIDYSLFIVSRFREERRHGLDKFEALSVTGGTANRAVFFSGVTVVLALMGMMIVPTTIFRGLATGAILVVAVSVAASLTLLPALLSVLGDKINWPRLSKRARVESGELEGGFWDRITKVVMGHPVVALVLATVLLLVLALPYFTIKTGFSGVETLPDELETKQAFVLMTQHFSGGMSQPTQIVIVADPTSAAVTDGIATLSGEVSNDPAFGALDPAVTPSKDGSIGMINLTMAGDPSSPESVKGVERLRGEYIPKAFGDTEVLVGGPTAMMKDFFSTTTNYTPWIFAFVLGLSFVLLTVVFRSIVVPIKAIIMNLLSVGAAYGLVVAVFQHGWLNDVFSALTFGYIKVAAIEAWLPLFMFSILFGLSMDYHVFLLSRIREEYDHTHDNGESVAFGLRTTGSIITGAALIMVAVFASFSHGRLVAIQEMGFGLAVAVLLDATIVRSVLVPSAMKLLGDRNWYLPKWLQWIPKVEIEGSSGRQQNRGNGNGGDEPGETELVGASSGD